MRRIGLGVVVALTLAAMPAVAGYKKLGAGPAWNTNYEVTARGTWSLATEDGVVVVTEDTINTVNCSGCDRVYFYPGSIFAIRNTSKQPVCAALFLTMKDKNLFWAGPTWGGTGQPILLPSKAAREKIAGITVPFSSKGPYDLGFGAKLHKWAPLDKKTCGPDPFA